MQRGNRSSTAVVVLEEMPRLTAFEQITSNLGLHPAEYQSSAELKEWVRENKDHKYVPSDLLRAWGFYVHAEI